MLVLRNGVFFFFLNLELKKFNEELGTSYYLERLLFR